MFATVGHYYPSLTYLGSLEPTGVDSLTVLLSNGKLPALTANIRLGLNEMTDFGEHSSLLWCSNNYGRKKFSVQDPRFSITFVQMTLFL